MDETISSYKQLIVWQKAMDLTTGLYKLTAKLPKEEQYGLTSQIRRAAVSIPCNIAEGNRRGTRKDYRSFLLISLGSGAELETQLEIVKRLTFVPEKEIVTLEVQLSEIMRMLNTMIQKLAA
jgi:four helix bundle protein